MSTTVYDLAVAYRIYPRVSKTPALFPEDKLKLANACLKSFKASLGTVRAKMFVLLDGCPPEYDRLFLDTLGSAHCELVRLNSVGNQATFSAQIDLLLNQTVSDFVYFAEDDYFYRPNQFPLMLSFLQQHADADFVSPYDHPDYYSLQLHKRPCMVRFFGDRHWRTAASTCLTFLTRKQILKQTRSTFRTYARRNLDVSLWMSLTKHTVTNPMAILRCSRELWQTGAYAAMSWAHNWPQLIFGRRYNLWSPIPAIATHMEKSLLSPGIDWHLQFANPGKTESPEG
jgi:hypothetical protein